MLRRWPASPYPSDEPAFRLRRSPGRALERDQPTPTNHRRRPDQTDARRAAGPTAQTIAQESMGDAWRRRAKNLVDRPLRNRVAATRSSDAQAPECRYRLVESGLE